MDASEAEHRAHERKVITDDLERLGMTQTAEAEAA